MELRQLEYFVAVVEESNFTRAAERVHVAQPGVSAQIRRLERELGQELLDRSGRTVRPTAAGEAVLPHARAALAAVAGARAAVDELAGLIRGHVSVGMVTAGPTVTVADMLAGFHAEHPGVGISLSEDTSARLLGALREGRLDVALVGLAGPPPPGVSVHVLVDEPFVAAAPPGDPLAARDTITLEALCDRELIALPRGTGLRTALDNACARAGFTPRVAFEASDPNILARLAARGLGVAILPTTVADTHASALRAVTITRPGLRGRIALAWRSDGPASSAAAALVAHARLSLPARQNTGARSMSDTSAPASSSRRKS
ncbi:LysR family transcriptional regulator [Rhodococcus oryzae]|uniref:LysR family transcriptional regulator n=1 Tax=Rhodococcus oryzae TaxID=2571143 RepID=A0ABY2RNJ2_9NOCA|nr:LysR family transcriptional regulator [Rhodococcus oryzae]TJZ79344.1 LysR family transcriptional regulator [Rhodococcus oryzae]